MNIQFRCEQCGKRYAAAETMVGQKARCKACGHLMTITPEPATAPAPPQAPPAPPPPPSAPPLPLAGDAPAEPDADLDALAALERDAVVRDQPRSPSAIRRQRVQSSPRAAATAEPAQNAPYIPPLAQRLAKASPFVRIPGEDLIDRLVPWLTIGVFAAGLAVLLYRGAADANEHWDRRDVPWDQRAKAIAYVCGWVLGIAAAVAGVVASLCTLGVFVASRIMRFACPPRLFVRCLCVACAPAALTIAWNRFDMNAPPANVPVYVTAPVVLAMLWLLLRLKPAPFAVTAAFALLFTVGLPLAGVRGLQAWAAHRQAAPLRAARAAQSLAPAGRPSVSPPDARQAARPGLPGVPAALPAAATPMPGRGVPMADAEAPPGTAKTAVVGNNVSPPFVRFKPNAGPVVGFRYTFWSLHKPPSLSTFDPVYAEGGPVGDDGPTRPGEAKTVMAREGYAVAGVSLEVENRKIVAARILFMRLKDGGGGALDPADQYESDWIGTPSGGQPERLAGDGQPVVGTYGRASVYLHALGLLVASPAATNP